MQKIKRLSLVLVIAVGIVFIPWLVGKYFDLFPNDKDNIPWLAGLIEVMVLGISIMILVAVIKYVIKGDE